MNIGIRALRSSALLLALCSGLFSLSASAKLEFGLKDGSSVKGELVGAYGGLVYIDCGVGKTAIYRLGDLDAASVERVDDWFQGYVRELLAGPGTVAESDSKLSGFLADKLKVWREGKLVDYDFASKSEPEFYAFYFSAHWCGPCRRFTPLLTGFYNAMKEIGRDNFEVIFVSSDKSKKMMETYMEEYEMPWPAIAFGQRSNARISKFRGSGIPCLVITDRDGNLLNHSYRGTEYLGPGVPKDFLLRLLRYTESIKKKLAKK